MVPRAVEIAIVAKGRNVFTGLPESFEITSTEIYEAIKETADSICNCIRTVLSKTDPDLISDIIKEGIYLAGGGSLIFGMDKLISEYTGTPVHTLEDPTHSVVRGAAVALRNPELLKNVNYQLRSIKELTIE